MPSTVLSAVRESKERSAFDLPIALGILIASQQIRTARRSCRGQGAEGHYRWGRRRGALARHDRRQLQSITR